MAVKKQNKVTYVLIFVGGSSTLLVLLYFLVGSAVFRFTRSAEAELKSRQAALQEIQELVRMLPNPAKAAEDLKRRSVELKEIGYNKKQLPKLLQLIGKMAVDGGLTVVSIRPRDDIKTAAASVPPGVVKVFLELDLRCEYTRLGEYLQSISTLPYSVAVESLSLSKREVRDEEPPLECKVLVSACMVVEQ